MRGTGSTRTATRWWWSSATLLLAACVSSTQIYFEPPAGAEQLTGGEMRDRGDALLAAECPRLLGGRQAATGAARIGLVVDRQGTVHRAILNRTSGDKRVDELFGTLTAVLRFEPPTGDFKAETVTGYADVGYSCSPTAHVMTFRMLESPHLGQPPGIPQ